MKMPNEFFFKLNINIDEFSELIVDVNNKYDDFIHAVEKIKDFKLSVEIANEIAENHTRGIKSE